MWFKNTLHDSIRSTRDNEIFASSVRKLIQNGGKYETCGAPLSFSGK